MQQRIKHIFKHIETPPDVIVICNCPPCFDRTFFYVTGYTHGLFEQAFALLYPDGSSEVIVPKLEGPAAGAKARLFETTKERIRLIGDLLSGDTIGVHEAACSVQTYNLLNTLFPDASFANVGRAISKARMIKDQQEITRIKKACAIAADIATALPETITGKTTESAVKATVNYALDAAGATPAFDTIVASGKHAAFPHYTTGNNRLAWPILIDFGARCQQYCSDITRTLIAKNMDHKRAYESVAEAQQVAIDMIAPGVAAAEIHTHVSTFLVSRGFPVLPHATGHSLGLDVHDGFSISASSDIVFEQGMVLTIEPGVYLPDKFGIRIEDDILVTARRHIVLTKRE